MAEFRLETERLVMRDWRAEDWPRFWELTNTPAVMRWLGGLADDEAKAGAQQRVEGYARDHGHTFWLVERMADGGHLSGEVIGFCGLKRASATNSTIEGEFEVGWRLREDAWGHGYAKEAAIASLDAAFGQFEAEAVYAITILENEDSWGLMVRLGMERRADLDYVDTRFDKPWCDTIVYGIARAQWEKGE
ncbi:GNAT family N-acetyltransferase [Tsuneonella mangrovi]|uniref:GNAT family N-acetyltransferase n=1 Tax=Tsuneonella mangrovi TaxID=1982042 RepID=UPI000BA23521|nr:GNAT family N-acetyltransferase [Tsuneonella mangrovi]